nr:MAG TPA: hypothetical protein [Caudoviricetes sp.]
MRITNSVCTMLGVSHSTRSIYATVCMLRLVFALTEY